MIKIKLNGADNARDFGNTVNSDGKKIKAHSFIRSNALCRVNKKDIEILTKKFGLKTIIDLRTSTEISEKPDIEIQGVQYLHIPVFSESKAGITHEKNADKNQILDSIPDLCELYKSIVSDDYSVSQLRKIFEVVTRQDNNAVLWHCTEGKDRCGIVSALFLSLLGVDREAIINDYLMTNEASKKRAEKYYLILMLTTRDRQKAEKVKRVFSAEREYITAAFDEIEKNCGSIDNFIREKLKITDETKEQMKNRYLE